MRSADASRIAYANGARLYGPPGCRARTILSHPEYRTLAATLEGCARAYIAKELRYLAFCRSELQWLLRQSADWRAGRLAPHLQAMHDPATMREGPVRRARLAVGNIRDVRSLLTSC